MHQEYDTSFPNSSADVRPSPRWPLDISKSSFSVNRINVQDMASFITPVRYLNQDVGTDPADVRFDLVPGSDFGFDINIQDMGALIAGSTHNPAMFNGQRAFGGPDCPYAP